MAEPKAGEPEPDWTKLTKTAAKYVLLVFIAIAALQFIVVALLVWLRDGDASTFGISGDFFGFGNSLFSALAFAGIIVTLLMQKYELGEQRKQLELNRLEVRGQKEEMEQQNESLRRQTFENTFFSMLSLHNAIVEGIKADGSSRHGRPAFSNFVAEIIDTANKMDGHGEGTGPTSPTTVSVEAYEYWYLHNESRIGHYFRTLYNMVRYVDNSNVENKRDYTRLVRAQLSANELKLLCLNGLGKHGKDKFRPLIVRYMLLKHLSDDYKRLFEGKYDYPAFGEA